MARKAREDHMSNERNSRYHMNGSDNAGKGPDSRRGRGSYVASTACGC